MTLRRCTVEQVFGTLKHWMGWTHFLTKKLEHVNTEMSLHVLAYLRLPRGKLRWTGELNGLCGTQLGSGAECLQEISHDTHPAKHLA